MTRQAPGSPRTPMNSGGSAAVAGPAHAPLAAALVFLLTATPTSILASPTYEAPRNGALGMRDSETRSLLVGYYETYLRDHDIDSFRLRVSGRYTEGTLMRLVDSDDTTARRAAVLSLGLIGTFECNAAVARGLGDADATVRDLADNALWAIWFRADTPENNAMLEQVRLLIRHERLEEAVALSTRLIERAPQFAEAYNQRAIAHFYLRHFKESADDCKRVLERNAVHIGALSGLAQCQLQLDQRGEAIKTLHRVLRLKPYSTDLREFVNTLEASDD
jgi:tetratricopeptide (TPR) repeat protein